MDEREKAIKTATLLLNMQVKIPSIAIEEMKNEMIELLKQLDVPHRTIKIIHFSVGNSTLDILFNLPPNLLSIFISENSFSFALCMIA